MEPGASSRAEAQTGPPALPVKQRRSQRSRGSGCSSADQGSDSGVLSPLGPQHQNYMYSGDVFPETTDCHATQCPIHQRYDPPHSHKERFFSDDAPPPVPRKRMARALSLPCGNIPPPSPLLPMSPLSPVFHGHPQNFDNPVYMLTAIPGPRAHDERDPLKPGISSPVPLLSLSKLSFETPDEHLPYLFRGFDDQGVVAQAIQQRHLLSLRSMAQRLDAGILLQGEANMDYGTFQPQDFLLCQGHKPKQIGDSLYYSLWSPTFPKRVLSGRVHRWTNLAPVAHSSLPSHVNLQEVIVQFSPDSTLKNKSNTIIIKNHDPVATSVPSQSDCSAANPPSVGSIEFGEDQCDLSTLMSSLQQGYSVSIERDLPQVTLEDFILESWMLQRSEPLLYERQLCLLLLQLVMALQHLCSHAVTCFELRPQDIFLVWPTRESREKTEREVKGENVESSEMAIKMSQAEKSNRVQEEIEWENRKWEKEGVQMLWRTWGCPRVVFDHKPSGLFQSHLPSSINTQIGALLQHCLQPQDSFASLTQPGSAVTSSNSPYKTGLLDLASQLKDETSGLHIADTVVILQALLWGPRTELFKFNSSTSTTVHNWLLIKQALLVMKLAERGLVQDQAPLHWEDSLCLQYLAFADSETLMKAIGWMGFNLKMK